MLTFAVFDQHGPAQDWPLRHAYLFGPGEVPVQGEVRFENGLIRCERSGTEAAGLALQFPVDQPVLSDADDAAPPPGSPPLCIVTLRTCLLPDRANPYLLTLELARSRIMLLLNKLEEWGLFDLPADHPVMRRLELARALFTRALVAQKAPGGVAADGAAAFSRDADRFARRAIALAVDAGEQIALLQADRQIRVRYSGELYQRAIEHVVAAFGGDRPAVPPGGNGPLKSPEGVGVVLSHPPVVGCAASPNHFSEDLARTVAATCDFVTMPMRWIDMEPEEGKYSFAKTDRWIEWAVRHAKMPVVAGPVVDFRPSSVPEWLFIWENDYETLRELVYEHVKNIVTRYRRTISRWTVASGLHANQGIQLALEQILDLTRICTLLVRKLHPQAKIQLELVQPWGEYHARSRRSLPPMLYAEMLGQAGIPIDALALRIQAGQPAPGRAMRDLLVLSEMLDRYAELDKPISVTAVGAPSQPIPAGPDAPDADPGIWHAPWSPAVQADWLAQVFGVCLAKPYVQGVCWQELTDAGSAADMPFGGLLNETGAAKPAAKRLQEIRQALRERRSPLPPSA